MRRMAVLAVVAAAALAVAATALARVPDEVEIKRVSELAKQMDIDADEAYVEAVNAAGEEPSAEETEALQKLFVLKESAEYFNEQVDEAVETPKHTRLAFERLNTDFIEARACFTHLGAYEGHRELFDTIEDGIGNMRYYYVAAEVHTGYPDHKLYPYYPGFHLFVHVYGPDRPYHFRHVHRWHLHPKYFEIYPHRHEYRRGYGRHKVHYAERARHRWHKKVVKKKIIPLPKVKAQPKPKPGPGPGPGSGGKGKGK